MFPVRAMDSRVWVKNDYSCVGKSSRQEKCSPLDNAAVQCVHSSIMKYYK